MADGFERLPAADARPAGALVPADPRQAGDILDAAVARYMADRRARVPGFVDRHFTVRGALALHRHALGWDLLRAPANLAAAVPQSALRLGGRLLAGAPDRRLRALGDRLGAVRLFRETDVGRALAWAVQTELLELPARHGERVATHDALAAAILADPRLVGALSATVARLVAHRDDAGLRDRVAALLDRYTGSRGAAADIATALLAGGAGLAAGGPFTPGALSLGPVVAAALARHAAAAPAGSALGALWLAGAPAGKGAALAATGGAVLALGAFAAFAGVVADPVQRRLGLHRRRLERLLDALEAALLGRAAVPFEPRDQYVARVFDLLDLIRALQRLVP